MLVLMFVLMFGVEFLMLTLLMFAVGVQSLKIDSVIHSHYFKLCWLLAYKCVLEGVQNNDALLEFFAQKKYQYDPFVLCWTNTGYIRKPKEEEMKRSRNNKNNTEE